MCPREERSAGLAAPRARGAEPCYRPAVAAGDRPKLRALEAVVTADDAGERMLMLRDSLGITDAVALLPMPLVAVVARFDGMQTLARIQAELLAATGERVPIGFLEKLARDLDRVGLIEGPAFEERRRLALAAFRAAPVRPATHAGGAYESQPAALRAQIESALASGDGHAEIRSRLQALYSESQGRALAGGRLVGLVAPHIDPRRGATGYAHAYRQVAERCDADLFVVFGTAHAPMATPFAVTDKPYDTPLGAVPTARGIVHAIERRVGDGLREDEFVHAREHSIEFQAVFLRHLASERPIEIVPILCGALGRGEADPWEEQRIRDVLDAVRQAVAADGRSACYIAAADLAHVGPRFGDREPLGPEALARLSERDQESLARVAALDAPGFYAHVIEDDAERRICGLSPIYAMLRCVGPDAGVRGRLLCYEQCVDPDDGSTVSYAALGLYAPDS